MPGFPRTQEQKEQIVRAICKAVANRATVNSACETNSIDIRTFRRWIKSCPSYLILYKKAVETQTKRTKARIKKKALSVIERDLDWKVAKTTEFNYVEELDEDTGNMVRVKVPYREVHREIPPVTNSAFFALKSLDPDFKEKDKTEVNPDVKISLNLESLGLKEFIEPEKT